MKINNNKINNKRKECMTFILHRANCFLSLCIRNMHWNALLLGFAVRTFQLDVEDDTLTIHEKNIEKDIIA